MWQRTIMYRDNNKKGENMTRFFTKKQASEYLTQTLGLPVAIKTLSKFITIGGGPEFQKFGTRVVYSQQSLDAWAESRLSKPYKHSSEIEATNE